MQNGTKISIALILAIIVVYFVVSMYGNRAETVDNSTITSYEECVAAGYTIMESYPEQCAVPNGPTFTRIIDTNMTNSTPDPVTERTVLLYYYNETNDTDETGNVKCSADGLVAVERTIGISESPMQDAVRLLLTSDLTEAEIAAGITTEFPLSGLTLEGVTVADDGVLVLQFNDPELATSGGSCRTNILWQQIQATATQFETINEVSFEPEELFQP